MAIEGNLQDMSMVDIIQLNCRSRESASVTVRDGDHKGVIYFAAGQVTHAIHNGEKGEEAIYQLLKCKKGHFVIEKGVESPERSIDVPWSTLLMRNLHRLDNERDRKNRDNEPLRELADRLDSVVAASTIDGEGETLSYLMLDGASDVEKTLNSLSAMTLQVARTLDAADAGSLVETITITSKYRFITRPVSDCQAYVQLVLNSDSSIGAARMHLAAYLAVHREELLEKGGCIDQKQTKKPQAEDVPVFEFEL